MIARELPQLTHLAHLLDLPTQIAFLLAKDLRHTSMAEIPDVKRLRLLHSFFQQPISQIHQLTQQRLRLNATIRQARASNQRVAIVWSGMDCDGVQYSGHVHYAYPTLAKIHYSISSTQEWLDGPATYEIMLEADAAQITYQSRDLALEAFENGHPHFITGASYV